MKLVGVVGIVLGLGLGLGGFETLISSGSSTSSTTISRVPVDPVQVVYI